MDVCDENNNIVGQGMKSEILRKGLWHRTARVFVCNSQGGVLLQLRSKNKELYADRWDVGAAGHIAAGENCMDAAIREAKEEIGLIVAPADLELLAVEKFQLVWGNLDEKAFGYTYLAKFDGSIGELKIQAEEVQELKFISVGELEKDVKISPQKYSPHPESYWQMLINGVRKACL